MIRPGRQRPHAPATAHLTVGHEVTGNAHACRPARFALESFLTHLTVPGFRQPGGNRRDRIPERSVEGSVPGSAASRWTRPQAMEAFGCSRGSSWVRLGSPGDRSGFAWAAAARRSCCCTAIRAPIRHGIRSPSTWGALYAGLPRSAGLRRFVQACGPAGPCKLVEARKGARPRRVDERTRLRNLQRRRP